MKMIRMSCPQDSKATLEGYLLDCEITLGQEKNRPAVIVGPGGGYVYCSPREGEPVALRYAAKGFHAFILRYSVGYDYAGFAPWKELSWAIGYIRENAEQWNVDPGKIAVCGFSAATRLSRRFFTLCFRSLSSALGTLSSNAMNSSSADGVLRLSSSHMSTRCFSCASDSPRR